MIAEDRQHKTKRIVTLCPDLSGVGGIQEASRLTAWTLNEIASRSGWSTEFLSLNDPRGPQTIRFNDRSISYRGFCKSKVDFIRAALQLAGRGTEVVVAAHPHLAIPAAQMKLVNGSLRMVTISHGIEVWTPLRWSRGLAFRRSDLFLSPSRYTAEKIVQEQSVPGNRVRCLSWPLNPEVLHRAEHPEQMPLPPGFPNGLVVLTVCRLAATEQYKGVDKLIQAVARLRPGIDDIHLVVVGGGDDLGRHLSLAATLRVTSCVHFFDNLSRDQIAGCYLRSDVFALPSTGEGFGLVFLEAMAFGKPLIGALAGGIPDVIEDGANGFLVSPEDLDQLCQALTVLLTNQQLRLELGTKGAELVRTKFAFGKFCAEVESILRDCGLDSETQ